MMIRRLVVTPLVSLTLPGYLYNHKKSTTKISLCECSINYKYSSYTYPANDPIEDRFVIHETASVAATAVTATDHTIPKGKHTWSIASVYDGHGGYNVSEYASNNLTNVIIRNLSNNSTDATITTKDAINKSIIQSFEEIETGYIDLIKESYRLGFGDVAKVGSCVLLALKNKESNDIVIANCGDCRAVMGSVVCDTADTTRATSASGTYMSTRLTRDHNARVPLEALNLQLAHPNESDIVICKNPHACYVKGRLQLTRSLGDLYLKHEDFNRKKDEHRSRGRRIEPPFTPPYVSHVPDIFHVTIDKQTDKFIILATDGLWDYLSDKEAVDIVASCQGIVDRKVKAAELLVEAALRKAADESRLSYDQLLQLKPGRNRRSRHDDTTAVVMYL